MLRNMKKKLKDFIKIVTSLQYCLIFLPIIYRPKNSPYSTSSKKSILKSNVNNSCVQVVFTTVKILVVFNTFNNVCLYWKY